MSRFAALLVPIAVLLLALATLSACGTPAPPYPSASPDSGVRGSAKTAGGPAKSDGTAGVSPSGAVSVVAHEGMADGPFVASTLADHAGKFSIDLRPGTYTLVQVTGVGGRQPKTVTVRPGEYTHVTLWQFVP